MKLIKSFLIIICLSLCSICTFGQNRNIAATREYVDKQIEFAESRITDQINSIDFSGLLDLTNSIHLKRDLTNNIVASDSAISNRWVVTPKMPYTINIEWDPYFNGGSWLADITDPSTGLVSIEAITDVHNRQGDINAKELIFDLNIYDQTITFTAVFIEKEIFAIRGESYVSQTFVENVSSNTIEYFKRDVLTNSIIGIVTETSPVPTSEWIDDNTYDNSATVFIHTNGTPYVTYDYASGIWTLHGVSVENNSGSYPNGILEFSNQLKAPENALSLEFTYYFNSDDGETQTVDEGMFIYTRDGYYVNKLGIVFTKDLEEASSNLYDTIVDNVINPDFDKFSNSVMSVMFGTGTNGVTCIISNFLSDANSNYNEFISGVNSNYNEFIGGIDTNSIATIGEFLIKYNDGFEIKDTATLASTISLILAILAYLIKKLSSAKRYDTVSIFSDDYTVSLNDSGERVVTDKDENPVSVSKYAEIIVADKSVATLKDRAMNYVTSSSESLTLNIPPIVRGKARDFHVTLDCKNGSVYVSLEGATMIFGDSEDISATTGVIKMFIFTEIAENKWFINKILDSSESDASGSTDTN